MKNWFEIKASAKADEVEVLISDVITSHGYWGTSAKNFIAELNKHKGKQINLRINSPGGSVFDGLAIYNYLSQRGKVNVIIDGIAASIASIIALAGEKITMGAGAFFMIHNPFSWGEGESEDLRKVADTLDKIRDSMAEIYAQKTGNTLNKIKEWMKSETWFTAKEAVSEGFATDVFGEVPAKAFAGFNFAAMAFQNLPDKLKNDENFSWNTHTNNKNEGEKTAMNKLAFVTLLAAAGINITENAPDAEFFTNIEAALKKAQQTTADLATAKASLSTLEKEKEAIQAKVTTLEATAHKYATEKAEAAINAAIESGKLKTEAKAQWLKDYLADPAATKARLETVQDSKASGTSPVPSGGGSGGSGDVKNPFMRATWNLTEQSKIYKEDNALAKTLIAAAAQEKNKK